MGHILHTLRTGLVAVALTGLVAGGATASPRDETYFTNLPLVTQTGETVRFYDDLIRDRIVVINFVYTECPDLCSLSTARLAQIYDWLGDRVGRDIFFYSISLDPETDTPEKLARFAEAFGVGEGWLFLTGRPEDIDTIRFRLGERSRALWEHRSDMVIGNGGNDVWRRTSVMGNLQIATRSILELDPEWKPAAEPVATDTPEPYMLDGHPGEGFFLKVCAACHTIGAGTRIGPDLAGVTLRRDRDWLLRYLMAPDMMLAQGDPVAVALDAKFPEVRMPFLDIGREDAEDLVQYLQTAFDSLTHEEQANAGAEAHDHDHATHGHETRIE